MIVVCGEALFDVFAGAETPTGVTLDARIGGSPFNVAVGLARLNQKSCLLTNISRGFLGERLLRALQAEGVDTTALQRSDAPTTLSLVGVGEDGAPSYAFYGDGCADRGLTLDALNALPSDVQAFHIGSIATVLGETARTQRALVEREHHRTVIAYDPNIRINVEPKLSIWRDQIQWMMPRTHLLKVSEEDLDIVEPGLGMDTFAQHALAQGVACVIVTRGARGAMAWTHGGQVETGSIPVDVVDTVGAGDTFQAAMLTWLAEHHALSVASLRSLSPEALRSAMAFAAYAATLTCSRRGADLPRRSELPSREHTATHTIAPPLAPAR